jgi:glutaredoxin
MGNNNMIRVYTTATCAYCAMVKKYLTSKGKDFETVDITDDPDTRQYLMDVTGAMTVPITMSTEYTDDLGGMDTKYIIGWKPAELALL